jgi:hypothetical protein
MGDGVETRWIFITLSLLSYSDGAAHSKIVMRDMAVA